ncbi:unnamed protein product [Hymenolepis diminuta]|uniref:Uncharacterized protein n=1 Tax=Hymenolepis diminuta TaxID=6216 RepID=A0A564YYF0_HYMDI|nr:unnamed protein product [Hymenolepis diminuta]
MKNASPESRHLKEKEPTSQPIILSTPRRMSKRKRKNTQNTNFIYDLPKPKRGRTASEQSQCTQTGAQRPDSEDKDGDEEIKEPTDKNSGKLNELVVCTSKPKRWYERRLSKSRSGEYPLKDSNEHGTEEVKKFTKTEISIKQKKATIIFAGDGDIDAEISRKKTSKTLKFPQSEARKPVLEREV